MKEQFFNEERWNIISVVISGTALLLSLSKWAAKAVPFDLAWIVIILCGIPIVYGAVKGVVYNHDIKADVLVSIAMIASIFIKQYFAAGEVAFIMAIGTLLEDGTARKTRQGIEKLIKLTPQTARVVRGGCEKIIPAGQVEPGDTLIVFAGETIAVDGIITSGRTNVDQSMMTGESMPVDKTAGDTVISGTVNQFGTFEMRALKVGEDSSLQRMIRLVEEADSKKAPIVGIADRWATWLVLAALSIAAGTWLGTGQIIRAVTVLVVICPCAFILATPTAIMAGIGNAARFGILIRSGDAVERISKVKHIAFDKTGTLTYGKPEVIVAESFVPGISQSRLLYYAACAEKRSEHPLGKAVLSYYKTHYGDVREPRDFMILAGQGVQATVEDKRVWVGKAGLFEEYDISIPEPVMNAAGRYISHGATAVFVSIDMTVAGFIILADIVREDAAEMVAQLEEIHIEPMLITGDNPSVAHDIAGRVGIKCVKADLLPEDKMRAIEEYQNNNMPVCMIGDGINDALALKSAYVGVAMGGVGSDIAVESADVVLVSDDIKRIPYLMTVAGRTMGKIKQNIIFSMSLNLIAVVLSITGLLDPVIGAIVHNVGSVAVVLNSTLLLTMKDV